MLGHDGLDLQADVAMVRHDDVGQQSELGMAKGLALDLVLQGLAERRQHNDGTLLAIAHEGTEGALTALLGFECEHIITWLTIVMP